MIFHSIIIFLIDIFLSISVPECMSQSNGDPSWYNLGMFSEFELQRVECMNNTSTGKVIDFMVTINRVSRNLYAIGGKVGMDPEKLPLHQIEALLFFSKLGNNQYTLLPFSIKLKPLCLFLNTDYRKMFMNRISNSSDIPLSEDENEDICLLFEKKIYKVTNLQLGTPAIPMDSGLYKGYINIYNENMNVVTGIVLYFKVT